MRTDQRDDARVELLRFLMRKVEQDRYPSATMLDIVESLLRPPEVPAYVEMLVERVEADEYPSMDLIRRVHKFVR